MITIPIPDHTALRNVITYSISPLFELAASLHTLAQPEPPCYLKQWVNDTLRALETARLSSEWQYVAPAFRWQIPEAFDPIHTQGIMAVDDQYDYFVKLPAVQFYRSLAAAIDSHQSTASLPTIRADLEEDPDFVKGRFSLFISSYWQLLFESKWEEIAPVFVREAEWIEHALNSMESMLSFLGTVLSDVSYNAEWSRLELSNGQDIDEVRKLILYPSHFLANTPTLLSDGSSAHLMYQMYQRTQ